ncbi:MAG: hypothetical protein JSR91_07125 [Proteobacteria bacterium]|nr:hypothetical protein [Pseudomonadota bacterium]
MEEVKVRQLTEIQNCLRLAQLERLAGGHLKKAIEKGAYAQARRASRQMERVNSALMTSSPFVISPFKNCEKAA